MILCVFIGHTSAMVHRKPSEKPNPHPHPSPPPFSPLPPPSPFSPFPQTWRGSGSGRGSKFGAHEAPANRTQDYLRSNWYNFDPSPPRDPPPSPAPPPGATPPRPPPKRPLALARCVASGNRLAGTVASGSGPGVFNTWVAFVPSFFLWRAKQQFGGKSEQTPCSYFTWVQVLFAG